MSGKTQSLEFSRTIKVEPKEVYRAFTNATALREWLADVVEADARKDGRLYLWWNVGYYAVGLYGDLEKDKSIAFSWHGLGEAHPTQVNVKLEADKGGSRVTLTHSGIGDGEPWVKSIEGFKREWESSLENLQSMLETGLDQRIYRRPMFGMAGANQVDADFAKKHNLPVEEGLQLTVVIDGLSAHNAGIRKGDILVGLGEYVIKDFPTLRDALGAHKAGDRVEAKYYRDGKLQTVTLEFLGRPKPNVPAKAADLAKQLEQVFAESDAQLEQALNGVSDEIASRRPGEDEYSVKEVLAHLIGTQQDLLLWGASLVDGNELNAFTGGNTGRMQAIIADAPTVPDLLNELKRAQARTIELVRQLPDDFVTRKSGYVRWGDGVLNDALYHNPDHLNQIQTTIAAMAELVTA